MISTMIEIIEVEYHFVVVLKFQQCYKMLMRILFDNIFHVILYKMYCSFAHNIIANTIQFYSANTIQFEHVRNEYFDSVHCLSRYIQLFQLRLSPTSFPGSLLLSSGRDPGCGQSRASQILGGKFNCNCERGGKGACLQRFKIATLGDEIYCEFATRNRKENS